MPWSLGIAGAVLLALLVFPFLSMLSALPRSEHSALLSRATLDAAYTTIVAATVAVAADAAFGIPLAYWIATSRSRLRHLGLVAALLPLAVPPVVGGLELVLWLGPYGWLGRALNHLGLSPLDTLRGTILADMVVAAPFVVVTARAAFLAVEPAVTDAARSLGAGPWRTLVSVTLPAARRAVAAGLALGWLRAVGEFGTSIVVAYHPFTLSNLAYVQLSERGVRTALPTGALLAALGVVSAVALLAFDTGGRRRRPSAAAPLVPIPVVADREPRPPASSLPGSSVPAGDLLVEVAGRAGDFALEVSLRVPATAVAILGSSGAGKSLTLRTVAGLLHPPSGKVELAGQVLLDTDSGVEIPAERRGLGYVGQEGALFRHLDVEHNVLFGLRKLPAAERGERLEEVLTTFGLQQLRRAQPQTLSGGERQQVALARALAPRPRALLLDEPFSSLDAGLRRDLREGVRSIHDQTGIPFVLVTHDRDDALDLADYVVVLEGGRVVQQGSIDEVFARPVNATVARLVGIPNVLDVQELSADGSGRALAQTAWGRLRVDQPPDPDGAWALAVPSDAVAVHWGEPGGVVTAARPGVTGWRVTVRSNGATGGHESLVASVPRNGSERPVVGAACDVVIDGARCHLMAQ